MNAVPFDTLKMAQRLEAAGFSIPQAAGASEALAEVIVGSNLVTKDDLSHEMAGVRAEIGAVRGEIGALRSEIGSVRNDLKSELRQEIGGLRSEVMREIAVVRSEMELLRRDMTIKLGGMIFVAVGVLLAAMRYMPHS